MITVYDSENQPHQFDAVAIRTDEHNNLEVAAEVGSDIRPVAVFNRTDWRRTEVDYG